MPTFCAVNTELASQFDAGLIQEFAPVTGDKTTSSGDSASKSDANIVFVDKAKSLMSVFIPVYPGSQFWLAYTITGQVPPGMIYFFKFFIKDKHIVSWGITEEQNYAGKLMFKLDQARRSRGGTSGVMVRYVLRFAAQKPSNGEPMEVDDFLELRVYRSHGRKPVPYTEAFTKGAADAIGDDSAVRYASLFFLTRINCSLVLHADYYPQACLWRQN